MSVADERDLVIRAQRGDVEAFGELVRGHQSAVFNVAYRMVGNRHDAEDLAQESLLRAFRAFGRFDPDRPLRPWLKRIAANLSLNWLQLSRVQTTDVVTDMRFPGQGVVMMDSYAESRPMPEQTVIRRETAEQIRTAILQLLPHYRAVIELRHFQNLSYDEMAETLERSLTVDLSERVVARLSAELKPRPIPRWTVPIIGLQFVAALTLFVWLWPVVQLVYENVGEIVGQTAEQLQPDLSFSDVIAPMVDGLASGLQGMGDIGGAFNPNSPLPILEGFLIIGLALILWLAGSGLLLKQSLAVQNKPLKEG
jgi:RNA polymerase sigma-70 factor (ECF subfamily)